MLHNLGRIKIGWSVHWTRWYVGFAWGHYGGFSFGISLGPFVIILSRNRSYAAYPGML